MAYPSVKSAAEDPEPARTYSDGGRTCLSDINIDALFPALWAQLTDNGRNLPKAAL